MILLIRSYQISSPKCWNLNKTDWARLTTFEFGYVYLLICSISDITSKQEDQFTEMLVIGRLAPRWNVPIIAHMSGDDALADKSVFSTLGSVALTSATEMARATFTYLRIYNWQKVSFFRRGRKGKNG